VVQVVQVVVVYLLVLLVLLQVPLKVLMVVRQIQFQKTDTVQVAVVQVL
tara:strand:- start:217 stop:363 length:147 start_codon:yes stop_codon:yes gene_type:complete